MHGKTGLFIDFDTEMGEKVFSVYGKFFSQPFVLAKTSRRPDNKIYLVFPAQDFFFIFILIRFGSILPPPPHMLADSGYVSTGYSHKRKKGRKVLWQN